MRHLRERGRGQDGNAADPRATVCRKHRFRALAQITRGGELGSSRSERQHCYSFRLRRSPARALWPRQRSAYTATARLAKLRATGISGPRASVELGKERLDCVVRPSNRSLKARSALFGAGTASLMEMATPSARPAAPGSPARWHNGRQYPRFRDAIAERELMATSLTSCSGLHFAASILSH